MSGSERKLKYIYTSGPYTLGDTAINVRNAIEVGDTLIRNGHAPYIPHLSHFQHLLFPHSYKTWLDLDLQWIERCDAVIRLPGESKGADKECLFALELGLPVYFGLEHFLKHQ